MFGSRGGGGNPGGAGRIGPCNLGHKETGLEVWVGLKKRVGYLRKLLIHHRVGVGVGLCGALSHCLSFFLVFPFFIIYSLSLSPLQLEQKAYARNPTL